MALCELIEKNLSDDIIIKKFEHEDFKVGSRLVVKPYQTAVFVRDGKIHKTFEPGAYTLNSKIYPFITKLLSRVVFGTRNAFNCQVYFINTSQLDKIKYGVPGMHCSDAKYHVPITLGVHGSYMLSANNPELIMNRLCGGKDELRTERFREKYFEQVEMLVPEYLKRYCTELR